LTAPYSTPDEEVIASGTAPDGVVSSDEGEEATPPDPSGMDGGWWLEEEDGAKVKTALLELWKRQNTTASKREAREKRNELIRAGVRGVRVIADEETDSYTIRAPLSSEAAPKAPNKADQLIRRIAATLTVDMPAPEVTPNSDSDDERSAAELAERILKVEGSPAERDDASILSGAIDQAGTTGSWFRLTYLHPQACLKPVEIDAHPAAQTVDDALVVTTMGPDGQPMQIPADPATLVTRYVRADDTLTDTAAEARLGWEPKVLEKGLGPSQVRPVPGLVTSDVSTWPGAMVGEVVTLGDCIARFYGGERPDEDVCKQLVAWKPDGCDTKRWVPKALRDLVGESAPKRPDGTIADDALVAVLTLYLTSGPMAPLGAQIVIGGPKEPLVRQPWRETVGDGDAARVEYLPLPLAQMTWRADTATGDPYGIAGVEDLAPLEEMRATALKLVLDYVYRFGAPQTYLPIGTTLQPGQLARRDGTPIYITPEGRPFFEELPPLSPVVQGLYDAMGKEMDTASGLEAAAQGVASNAVKSGEHARQIIEQALVALASTQQNAAKFACRVWTLRLTFMRAYYKAPRMLKDLGEGGDYQVRAFQGTDLLGVGDIHIARGTGTMLPASAKASLAREEMQIAAQMGDQSAARRYYNALTGKTTPLLGLQDDPIRTRMLRQLAAWRDGAKAQHEPPPQEPGGFDEMGQPIPAPDPVAQQAMQVFAPNPTDELPWVAPLRVQELADAMASRAFLQADPRYQQALTAEYERMRQAAGIMTLAEQQQMQQQQQAQQQQMQLEQIETKNAEQAAKTAYAEKEGGPAAQRMAIGNAVEQGMRGQMNPNEGMP